MQRSEIDVYIIIMSLTNEQAQELDRKQNEAISNLKRFSYGYTPAPITPFPATIDDIKKFVSITPIGTYAPNSDGSNPVSLLLNKLPDKHTPETCIANAAMIKSRSMLPDFNNQDIGKTERSMSKTIKTQELNAIQNIEEYVVKENQAVLKSGKRDVSKTGTKIEEGYEDTYIPGLHFRATKNYSGYMGDNPNYFQQNPSRIDLDTAANAFFTDDMYLPTNFSNLRISTTTNATSNKSVYGLQQNDQGRHYFAVEWSGYFKPNQTGEWVFTTNSDDVSFLWVDSDTSNIVSSGANLTPQNATVDNRGLHPMVYRTSEQPNYDTRNTQPNPIRMTKDIFYPIKIQFSENSGGYDMIVTARCKNGGPTYTDFSNLFFAKVKKYYKKNTTYTYLEKEDYTYTDYVLADVTKTKQVTNYSLGHLNDKTISLGENYNPTYNITDPNAMYISMVKDTNITNGPSYDCYVTDDKTKVNSLNSFFGKTDDTTPKFNTINIWESSAQGNVNDANGYLYLSSTGVPTLDNKITISGIYSDPNAAVISGNVREEIPIMYITEDITNNVNTPKIIIYQKSTNTLNYIKLTDNPDFRSIMDKCSSGTFKQAPNKTWISDEARVLAYSPNDAEPNVPSMGIIYKITSNTAIVSNSQIFRLILLNGRLTLQMSIDPTKKIENDELLKYTETTTPNTVALLKIDVDHRMNSLNLLDRSTNASYFVPNDFAVYNTKYSTYDTYPSTEQIKNNKSHVTQGITECQTDCSTKADCIGYYTYMNGPSSMCSLVSASDPPSQLFNPSLIDATNGKLYMKNKTIDGKYNKGNYKIDSVSFTGANNTQDQKRAYYPEQTFDTTNKNCKVGSDGKLVCDPGLEYLKELVRITTKNKSDALSTPIESGDITAVEDTYKLGTDLIVNTSENFSNYMEAYTDLTVEGTNNIAKMCAPGYTGDTFGLCEIKDELNKINVAQDKILTNSTILNSNYGKIKEKVTAVDTKFKTLSNDVDNNNYKYDFNDYDDKPDTSMLGAIERDTNVLLLHENSMYIVGTIITTSLAILGVILARS